MGRRARWSSSLRRFLIRTCYRSHKPEMLGNTMNSPQVAADVVYLTSTETRLSVDPVDSIEEEIAEEIAAIKIQAAFRGYLARRAVLAVKRLFRLKRLVDGNAAKTQTTNAVLCMQTMARVQAQIHSRRVRMAEENQALLRQLQQKRDKELERVKTRDEWDDSPRTKEQLEACLLHKHEAAKRREKALAYAFCNQWKSSSRSLTPMFTDFNNPQWGWSWSERWMPTRPSENDNMREINDVNAPPRSSAVKPATKPLREACSEQYYPSAMQRPSQLPLSRQSPASPRLKPAAPVATAKKPASPSGAWSSSAAADDESKTKNSVARPSTSQASSPSYSSGSTPAARTLSRFHSSQSDRAGTPEKAPVNRRLSFSMAAKNSASPVVTRTRRHSVFQ